MKNVKRYYDLTNQIVDLRIKCMSICSDPMNVCPGDFAEDFERKINRVEMQRSCVNIPTEAMHIFNAYEPMYYEAKHEQCIDDLPWMQ